MSESENTDTANQKKDEEGSKVEKTHVAEPSDISAMGHRSAAGQFITVELERSLALQLLQAIATGRFRSIGGKGGKGGGINGGSGGKEGSHGNGGSREW